MADGDDMTELANEAAAHVVKMQDEITAGVNYWLHMAKAINRPMLLWYLTAEPAGDTQITETMENAWDFNAAEWPTQKTTDSWPQMPFLAKMSCKTNAMALICVAR